MKLGRKLAAAGLALALTLALAACGGGYTAADATALVKANLDILYLGQYDADYLSTTETSENDAEELYQNNLEGETGRMIGYYGMQEVSDEMYQELVDLQEEIYSHAQYEVLPATEQADGTYAVKVNISPVNIHVLVDEYYYDAYDALYAEYSSIDTSNMSDEEVSALNTEYNQAYNQMVLDLIKARMTEIGNEEETSVVIQVVQDTDGLYTPDENGLMSCDDLIITYP